MRKLFVLTCFFILSLSGFAQSTNKIKVFLECTRSWLCDFDYVRSEFQAVDFMRDRVGADVHVLVNMQSSSSGGMQAEVNFIGQKAFQNMSDTLTYFNDPTSTEDEQRKKLVQYLKLGLTRYIAKTKAAGDLSISFTAPSGSAATKGVQEKDPWNYWVFQFGANGSMNGNQNYRSKFLNSYFSADRETEIWKINASFSYQNNIDIYKEDSTESRFDRKGYDAGFNVARSIDQHWSYGLTSNFENSLYSNYKIAVRLRPKLEYSLFPYSQFNSQRIVFQYSAGPAFYNYYDTTVYFKANEWQMQQTLSMITSFTKPWGSINMGVFYSNYFDDFSKNNLSFNGAVSWKVMKGLNFAVWGNYALIHDQINLRKGRASRDELLVKNRELKSTFQYNLGVGFSYRFGSILNNIVNPRFRGLNYSISL